MQLIATTSITQIFAGVQPTKATIRFFSHFAPLMVVGVYDASSWGEIVDTLWERQIRVTNEGLVMGDFSHHLIRQDNRYVGYALQNNKTDTYRLIIEDGIMGDINVGLLPEPAG